MLYIVQVYIHALDQSSKVCGTFLFQIPSLHLFFVAFFAQMINQVPFNLSTILTHSGFVNHIFILLYLFQASGVSVAMPGVFAHVLLVEVGHVLVTLVVYGFRYVTLL